MKRKKIYIDIEPRWNALQYAVERGTLKPEILRQASELADKLRAIQKEKKIAIIYPNGTIKSTKRLKDVV